MHTIALTPRRRPAHVTRSHPCSSTSLMPRRPGVTSKSRNLRANGQRTRIRAQALAESAAARIWVGGMPSARFHPDDAQAAPVCALSGQLAGQGSFDPGELLAARAVGARPREVGPDALAYAAGAPLEVELDQLQLAQHGEHARAGLGRAGVAAAACQRCLEVVAAPRPAGARAGRGRRRSARGAGRARRGRRAARTPPRPVPRRGGRGGRRRSSASARAAGRRVERHQVLEAGGQAGVGRDRGPGGHRPCPRRQARPRSSRAPARRRGTSATATSTASPLVKQVARDAGEALAAAVARPGGPAAERPRRGRRSRRAPARAAPRSVPPPPARAARPPASGTARAVPRAARPSRSSGCARGGGRCRGRPPTPRRAPSAASRTPRRASASPAGRDQREAGVLALLPHAGHGWKRAAGTSRVGCGFPIPNGRSALELLGQARGPARRRAPRRPRAPRGSGPRARAPRRRGRRARAGTAPRLRRSISTPAAMRCPPKRLRCAAHAARPACRS